MQISIQGVHSRGGSLQYPKPSHINNQFCFNIICVQCNVIRNFIHIIPTPIIRSHRDLTNVQAISKAYSTEKSLLPYQVKEVYQYR